jgi:hypothetical protein
MASTYPGTSVLRALGSLQVAAILLVLLMVAMGSATVYESRHGSEQALAAFYGAPWFRLLLAFLAANVASAVIVRYPFRRGQVPFLMAHAGLLAVLAGALVTAIFGVDGQVTLAEGGTGSALVAPGDRLTLSRSGVEPVELDLSRSLGRGLAPVEKPAFHGLTLDGVRVQVLRFAPDVTWEQEVTDDAPEPNLALEVALHSDAGEERTWVFAGEHAQLGELHTNLRQIGDPSAWQGLLGGTPPESIGTVQVKHGENTFEFPLERCLAETLPLGDTGFTVHVLRYLPHATVGSGRALVNASDEPVNPAIEAEVAGGGGTERKIAFAKYPDFHGRASTGPAKDFTVYFVTSAALSASVPIELLAGPEGQLAVRFAGDDGRRIVQPLVVGQPLETPWAGRTLTVAQRFEHAQSQPKAVPRVPPRQEREPALCLAVTAPGLRQEFWLQKGSQRSVSVEGTIYRVLYANPMRPLGFSITLNQFRVGYYPGGERPRSFESSVRFTDPATGRDQSAVISMNRPASHKGYTLYQSSYQRNGHQTTSTLSVSRDPGRPVVFAGYAATMLGMALLLVRRLRSPGGAAGPRASRPAGDRQEVVA